MQRASWIPLDPSLLEIFQGHQRERVQLLESLVFERLSCPVLTLLKLISDLLLQSRSLREDLFKQALPIFILAGQTSKKPFQVNSLMKIFLPLESHPHEKGPKLTLRFQICFFQLFLTTFTVVLVFNSFASQTSIDICVHFVLLEVNVYSSDNSICYWMFPYTK